MSVSVKALRAHDGRVQRSWSDCGASTPKSRRVVRSPNPKSTSASSPRTRPTSNTKPTSTASFSGYRRRCTECSATRRVNSWALDRSTSRPRTISPSVSRASSARALRARRWAACRCGCAPRAGSFAGWRCGLNRPATRPIGSRAVSWRCAIARMRSRPSAQPTRSRPEAKCSFVPKTKRTSCRDVSGGRRRRGLRARVVRTAR